MEPLSRQEQWNVTLGRSQTKPAAFGCSKQATLLAGAGGKHFIPFSTENSNPEPLLAPLEKRSWPVPKYPGFQVVHQGPEGRGLNRTDRDHGWLQQDGQCQPLPGTVPPAAHPWPEAKAVWPSGQSWHHSGGSEMSRDGGDIAGRRRARERVSSCSCVCSAAPTMLLNLCQGRGEV